MTDSAFPPGAFSRLDESDDTAFYENDRFVSHLDSTALATVAGLIGRLVSQEDRRILDLMASWDSHIPESLGNADVAGLGLNRRELDQNERLAEGILHDLNANPVLPFDDETFDVVLCTASVDYLTRPVEVFAEVARVLKPGGLFLVVFSNRFFPPKVVQIWREANEEERIDIVKAYFEHSEGLKEPRVYASKGKPRPKDDRYADMAEFGKALSGFIGVTSQPVLSQKGIEFAKTATPASLAATEVEPTIRGRLVEGKRPLIIVAAAAVFVIGLVPPVTGAVLEWTEAAARSLVAMVEF